MQVYARATLMDLHNFFLPLSILGQVVALFLCGGATYTHQNQVPSERNAQNVYDVRNCSAFYLEILYKLKFSVLHIFLLEAVCAVLLCAG